MTYIHDIIIYDSIYSIVTHSKLQIDSWNSNKGLIFKTKKKNYLIVQCDRITQISKPNSGSIKMKCGGFFFENKITKTGKETTHTGFLMRHYTAFTLEKLQFDKIICL